MKTVQGQVIDTVCPGDQGVIYAVEAQSGMTYQWKVQGGSIQSGFGSNRITVGWGNNPGVYRLEVVTVNANGCGSEPSVAYVWVRNDGPRINYPPMVCPGKVALVTVEGASWAEWSNRDTGLSRLILVNKDVSDWVLATNTVCQNRTDTLRYAIAAGVKPNTGFIPETDWYRKNQSVTLTYTGESDNHLRWEIEKLNIFGWDDRAIQISLADTGRMVIKLKVTSRDGCLDSSERSVWVRDEFIESPNAFTPDADGLNDVFRPVHNGMRSVQLIVYNRWGEQVYSGSSLHDGWDGTYAGQPLPPDVYLYTIAAVSFTGKEYYLKGNVTLLR